MFTFPEAFPHTLSPLVQTLGKADINYHQFYLLQEESHFVRPKALKKQQSGVIFIQAFKPVVITMKRKLRIRSCRFY